jgi:hypothetical protein
MKKPFLHGINAVLPEGTKLEQDLNVVWQTYKGFRGAPPGVLDFESPANIVLTGFASIFDRKGLIAEGSLKDVLFGFNTSGWDLNMVAGGLTQLRAKGFIFYTDQFGTKMPEEYFITHPEAEPWVRYTKKFMDCFTA